MLSEEEQKTILDAPREVLEDAVAALTIHTKYLMGIIRQQDSRISGLWNENQGLKRALDSEYQPQTQPVPLGCRLRTEPSTQDVKEELEELDITKPPQIEHSQPEGVSGVVA